MTENSSNNWLGFCVCSSPSVLLSPLHASNSSSAQYCFPHQVPKLENSQEDTVALSLDIFHHNNNNSYYGAADCNAQTVSEMGNSSMQSLTSLSMSPMAQTPSSISGLESNKRGFGTVGQKKPLPRKSVDTFGQRTSQYRGVTKHRWTGRYEAHLWDNSCKKEGQTRKGRQVYHGGYDMEEKAARAYDLAALKYWGPSTHTNFLLQNYYKDEVEEMKSMTRQEYVAHLRRKSSGFSRGASMYRGVTRHHQHGRWQARIGRVAGNKDLYLGTFSTQEEAAGAYDIAAIRFRGVSAVTNFDMTRYDVDKILSSNDLLGGEQGKKIKALDHHINNAPIIDLIGDDQSNKSATVQISSTSSILTSLNSSSEASPDKSGSPSNMITIQRPKNTANGVISMAQLPILAAWNDAELGF